MLNPHAKSKEEIFKELNSSEKGLTNSEAKNSLQKYGSNIIRKKKQTPLIFKFLKQFNSPLIYILFVAMVISFIFDHLIDAYVILALVLINAIIGFSQERKSEKMIKALDKLVVSYAKVYRNNQLTKVPSTELVPGDIIVLEEGDKVPADARLFGIKNFRTQESSLTGESLPQEKSSEVLGSKIPMADRTNLVYMSTLVVSGTAKAIIVGTGKNTEVGKVVESIHQIIHPKMHFNKKVDQLAIQMAAFATIGAILTFIIGFFFRGLEFFEIFLFTIASLVSGIPEGLPAILIIVLAIGSRRMAKRNAIIRHLPAAETLGIATTIATDKTGTLTQNSMTIEKIITANHEIKITGNGWESFGKFFENKKTINPLNFPDLKKILKISALCNKANLIRKNGHYDLVGDPTEAALVVLAKKAGLDKNKLSEKTLDDLAFSSDLKFRATLTSSNNKTHLCSVGAFETLLNLSSYYEENGKKLRLTSKVKSNFLSQAEKIAKEGMRVLALAYKEVPSTTKNVSPNQINELIFAGLVGMKDPPRKDVKASIDKARKAGIRIIMKTGDHKDTAIAIAKEIGLTNGAVKAITGEELEKLSEEKFDKIVKEVNIFARVTPKMKLKIVESLQKQGKVVAMTGDGVNDAPALKRADIGIAMGIIGTDVARESSEMILADDNFSSIVNAIEEGRIIFQNVRQTSFYLITTNVAEDITIVSSLMMGFPLPMLPIQLLYLNLVTDGFTDLALAMEPGHGEVIKEKPKNKEEGILNKRLIPFLLLTAGLMVIGTIPLFKYFLPDVDKARTVAFVSMSMFQIFNSLNMRSLNNSIFKIGIFSNKWLIGGITISFLMMLGIIYLPWIRGIFQFVHLTFNEFLLISLIASSVFIFGELYKFFHKKRMI